MILSKQLKKTKDRASKAEEKAEEVKTEIAKNQEIQNGFDKIQRENDEKEQKLASDLVTGKQSPADVLSELSNKSKNRVRSNH